ALVTRGSQLLGRLLEVEHAALLDGEAVRSQLRVGHLLRESGGAGDQHGRPSGERVERSDPEPYEVRRWREMRLVADAARGVEAHDARAEECLEVGGEVARGAVVAGHDEGGLLRARIEQ